MKTDRVEGFVNVLHSNDYETVSSSGDLWIRFLPRKSGNFPRSFARVCGVFEPRLQSDIADSIVVDEFYEDVGPRGKTPYDELAKMIHELNQKSATYSDFKFIRWLDAILMVCDGTMRTRFLREHFFPSFSRRFEDGRGRFLATRAEIEKRLPVLRFGNLLQVNGPKVLTDMILNKVRDPLTMSGVQQSGNIELAEALKVVLGNFLPLRTHMVGGSVGLTTIYLLGDNDGKVIDRGPFPREEIELFRGTTFFPGDDPLQFVTGFKDPIGGWKGRFRASEYIGDDACVELISCVVDRFNEHVENRLEICNFSDDSYNVDFIEAFEKYLTLDRIIHECAAIATSTDSLSPRLMTFGVLDKFQELFRFADQPNKDRNFHYFCTREFCESKLVPTFSKLPSPLSEYFTGVARKLYEELYEKVFSPDGVWASFLINQDNSINVYRKYDEKMEQFVDRSDPVEPHDFVGEYVRATRNTHHGYISSGDRRRRFACFGSLCTGDLPDSLTQLPLLMLLAEILDPWTFSGHHWMRQ